METKIRLIVAGDIKSPKKKERSFMKFIYWKKLREYVEKFEMCSKSFKNYRAIYMQTEVCFIVSGDIKSP